MMKSLSNQAVWRPARNQAEKPADPPVAPQGGATVLERSETSTRRPPLYKVILLNDDFTPMDFVIDILKDVFDHGLDDAMEIMLQVHHQGLGVAGTFSREVAETKLAQTLARARRKQYPLQCTMEKA